jgi:hypothetical protein
MPNLPKVLQQSRTIAPRAKALNPQFPSIFRSIPEAFVAFSKFLPHIKILIVCMISIYLGSMTLSQAKLLRENREYLQKNAGLRSNIQKEILYWQKIAMEFKNYPDVYLKIASLEYRLGNTRAAQDYIEKALTINPHLETGQVLGQKISR